MAKISLGKIITGITVIGAGVALGLAIYNKFDQLSYDDNEDFEDDLDNDFDDDFDDDSSVTTYVSIQPISENDEDSDDNSAKEDTGENDDVESSDQ